MTRYTIEQQATAAVLFDGPALDKQNALNLMARDAGYTDYADLRHMLYDDEPDAYSEPPQSTLSDLEHAIYRGLIITETTR